MENKDINVTISFGSIAKAIFFLILLLLLWQLRDLVLIVLTAVVIASSIEPTTKFLTKYRVPRVIAVLLIYLFVFIFFAVIILFFIPPLLGELSNLSSMLPGYISQLDISNPINSISDISGGIIPESFINSLSIKDALDSLSLIIDKFSGNIFSLISTFFGGAFSFILIIVISFYLAVQEKGINIFLSTITPIKYEKYIIDLWRRSQKKIGLWMKGQLILAIIVGILVYLALTVFGVRFALLLAVIAAVFEIIPIFGPIMAAIPAVLMALLSGGSSQAFIVVILYIIIQQFENHLLYPLVVRQVIGIPSIIAIIALIAGGILAGFLGILLSVPLAVIFMELFDDLDREKHHLKKIQEDGA